MKDSFEKLSTEYIRLLKQLQELQKIKQENDKLLNTIKLDKNGLRLCQVWQENGVGRNKKLKRFNVFFHKWIEGQDEDGNSYTVALVENVNTGAIEIISLDNIIG